MYVAFLLRFLRRVKPVRLMTSCILQQLFLGGPVIMSIRYDRILGNLVLLRHRHHKRAFRIMLNGRRQVCIQPFHMCFTRMYVMKSNAIFSRQFPSQLGEPSIVPITGSRPFRTRMINMTRAIRWFLRRLAHGCRFHVFRDGQTFLGLGECDGGFILSQLGIEENPVRSV